MSRSMFIQNGVWAIISRISRIFRSIKFKLSASFFILMLAALIVIDYAVIHSVGSAMVQQRVKEQQKVLLQETQSMGELIVNSGAEELYRHIESIAQGHNGRTVVVNMNSVVIADSLSELNGQSIHNAQLDEVFQGYKDISWGTYEIRAKADQSFYTENLPYKEGRKQYWTVYYACILTFNEEKAGAFVASIPIQDLVDELDALTQRIILLSVGVGTFIVLVTLLLTRNTFAPLNSLNIAIAKMTKGDLNASAVVKGSGELAELAQTFNTMSKQIQTLDQARNEFVSNASHELKTPLASVKLLIDALLTQKDAPRELIEEFLNDVNHEIDRLNYVINDLLTLVRMDKNAKDSINMVPLQLMGLLDRVRHMLQPLASKRGIALEFKADEDLTVLGDAMKLQQAFYNLVDNAIKYSQEDTTVKIHLFRREHKAVVEIIDQGIGISPEDQKHIFERFYRVDKARSRQTGGTGLGLSIVDTIIRQHQGEIRVQSKEEVGTTFTVELKIKEEK